jgi:DNA polymerase III epsilon subunit-like protein
MIEGAVFNTEVKPIFDDEKAASLGLEPVQQEALDITRKTREQLEKAPTIDVVWPDFVAFTERYKSGRRTSNWDNVVPAGFNITNYDSVIVNRLCKQYGPYDDKYCSQKIFHPIHSIDIMHDIWRWTDNEKINSTNSKSLDAVREWLGMPKDGAHDGLNDVLDCAELLKRFMEKYRFFYKKTKFEGAMAGWKRPKVKV